jgi:putative glycosyltransferase (TIGR04372 family)
MRAVGFLFIGHDLDTILSSFRQAAFQGFPILPFNTALIAFARADLYCGNYDRSHGLLEIAYDIKPDSADTCYHLTMLCLVHGDESRAKKLLIEAIAEDRRYAMAHQNLAARYERDTWVPTDLDLTSDPELHLYDAYNYLGQILVNQSNDVSLGLKMFGNAMRLQQKLATRYEIPKTLQKDLLQFNGFDPAKPIRILPYEWVTQIGHLGMIDALLKMQRLGMRPDVNWVLLAPIDKVANQAFLDLWKPYLIIIQNQDLINALFPFQRICGEQFNCFINDSGEAIDWSDAAAQAFIEWDRQARGPLISLPFEIKEMGRKQLANLGMPPDAWFVALHVRSKGFYGEGISFIQSHRNASLHSYLPAIRRITEAGGWVVRMGDSNMERLKSMPQVLDITQNRNWSRSLDLYLWSQARFFLGTTSGPTNAAMAFHTPMLLVNCVSNYAQSWNNKVIFVLKQFWSRREQRYLQMIETTTPEFRAKIFNIHSLAKEGIFPKANSASDILMAVEEMLEYLDGDGLPAMQDSSPLEGAPYPLWLWGNAHPSKRFFSHHHELFSQFPLITGSKIDEYPV